MTTAPDPGPAGGSLPAGAEILRREGYVVLNDVLSPGFVERLRRELADGLDEKIRRFKLAPATREGGTDRADAVLNDFSPEGGNHDVNRWNMHLPSRSPFFDAELMDNPALTAILDEVLGEDWVYYILASDTPFSNSGVQPAHQDYSRLSIAINIPLVDVTEDNGPMELWPRTHRRAGAHGHAPFDPAPHAVSADESRALVGSLTSERLLMKAGSVLIRDHRVLHRGTRNATGEPRYMLSLYCIRPHEVPYRALADASAAIALLARRLGRGTGPAVQRKRLYQFGSVLGRVVEECSLTDRDYRRVLPAHLWDECSAALRSHLRFARHAGARDGKARGSLAGSKRFAYHWVQAVRDTLLAAGGEPRRADHYAAEPGA
jgi:ectoine hydroxylase-related dioxygenase (phytanoyl-CoA dioxygenase family)